MLCYYIRHPLRGILSRSFKICLWTCSKFTEYQYDARNRLTYLAHKAADGSVVKSFTYTLHPTGRRTKIEENDGRVTGYVYDDLYRLTSESIADAVNGAHNSSYSYDKVGNRVGEVVNGVTTAYLYDDNDRLLQTGGTVYTYDANGSTLTETLDSDVTTYGYNAKNELITAQKVAGGVTKNLAYEYDITGIRVSSTVDNVTTNYLVDHNQDYSQVVQEYVSGTPTVTYTYADDLVSQDRNSVVSTYLYDGLGSTRLLANESGTVTDTFNFEAFGEEISSTGTTENSYKFAGEQFDSALGMSYLRARYMDPSTGRMTQMDTFQGLRDDPRSLHKYLYTPSDPVNYIDPSGNTFTLNGLVSTINVASSLSSAAIAGYRFGQIATGERELSAREVGITLLIAGSGPVAGKAAALLGRKVAAGGAAGVTLGAGSIRLTAAVIKKKIAGSQYRTQQDSVFIPKIERYVEKMLNGTKFDPIKVDGDVIVDGHHRFIASKIAGVKIDVVPGTRAGFKKRLPSKDLTELDFSEVDPPF